MADDRERNQGIKQGGGDTGGGQQSGPGGAHEAPGRNPGTGQEAGDKGNLGGQQQKQNQEGSYKEGGQNEQMTR
ncbi:MAG: hypothetical protein ABR607_15935 [Pyrinomonadaceae bacterium]